MMGARVPFLTKVSSPEAKIFNENLVLQGKMKNSFGSSTIHLMLVPQTRHSCHMSNTLWV